MFPGAEMVVGGLFALSVGLTVVGGLIAVMTTRVIRSVCGLALCCLGLAGLFYFLHAPFLALMEVLIYIGAVCVTIVFAIMLAEPDDPKLESDRPAAKIWTGLALLLAGLAFYGLAYLATQERWPAAPAKPGDASLEAIGVSLLTTYSLAFELISLVLLAAILGALAIARGGRSKS